MERQTLWVLKDQSINWWPGNDVRGIRILVKEEVSANVEVRRKSDSDGNCANFMQRSNTNNMCVWATK